MKNQYIKVRITIFTHKMDCGVHKEDAGCTCSNPMEQTIEMGERILVLESFPLSERKKEYFIVMTAAGVRCFYLPSEESEYFFDVLGKNPVPVGEAA